MSFEGVFYATINDNTKCCVSGRSRGITFSGSFRSQRVSGGGGVSRCETAKCPVSHLRNCEVSGLAAESGYQFDTPSEQLDYEFQHSDLITPRRTRCQHATVATVVANVYAGLCSATAPN